jgi:uncharacterized membrane protein YoaK (UPF0700 family)
VTAPVRLPAVLALLAGVTDVTGWVLLGGLFTAHVTGNIVLVVADLVAGTAPRPAAVLALPLFVVVTVVATAVARRLAVRCAGPRRVLLAAQALLLVLAAALSFTGHASTDPQGALALAIGLCAVAAMATQNAYLHLASARAPSTAVMTGNLVAATIAAVDLLVSRGRSTTALARWNESWPLLAGFVSGCLIGAGASALVGDHAAVVPALLAVAVSVVVTVTPQKGRSA